MHTMLAKKDDEVERTNDLWQTDQQALEAARLQIAQLEDSVRREVDSKKRIEQMLKSYKDEVGLWFVHNPPSLLLFPFSPVKLERLGRSTLPFLVSPLGDSGGNPQRSAEDPLVISLRPLAINSFQMRKMKTPRTMWLPMAAVFRNQKRRVGAAVFVGEGECKRYGFVNPDGSYWEHCSDTGSCSIWP